MRTEAEVRGSKPVAVASLCDSYRSVTERYTITLPLDHFRVLAPRLIHSSSVQRLTAAPPAALRSPSMRRAMSRSLSCPNV